MTIDVEENKDEPRPVKMNARFYRWENTHQMLGQKGVNGIKTGVTQSAGPCLCTSILVTDKYSIPFIVVLLNCRDMEIRWMETWKLAKWSAFRMQMIKQYKTQLSGMAATGCLLNAQSI